MQMCGSDTVVQVTRGTSRENIRAPLAAAKNVNLLLSLWDLSGKGAKYAFEMAYCIAQKKVYNYFFESLRQKPCEIPKLNRKIKTPKVWKVRIR